MIVLLLMAFSLSKASCVGEQNECVKPRIIFVIGGPGSGKGTQCTQLTTKYDTFVHISTGDLVREQIQQKNGRVDQMSQTVTQGGLVNSDFIVEIVFEKIKSVRQGKTILLDGFPRSMENVATWQTLIGDKVNLLGVVHFELSFAQMEERLIRRGIDSGRSDDTQDAIKTRLNIYKEQMEPIINYFKSKVIQVDSSRSINEVFLDVERSLLERQILPIGSN